VADPAPDIFLIKVDVADEFEVKPVERRAE